MANASNALHHDFLAEGAQESPEQDSLYAWTHTAEKSSVQVDLRAGHPLLSKWIAACIMVAYLR